APYAEQEPEAFQRFFSQYHEFKIQGHDRPVGHILNDVVSVFPWTEEHWAIDSEKRTVTLLSPPEATVESRSEMIAQTLTEAVKTNRFSDLKGWRNEQFSIFGTVSSAS
ncbi:hypothetical protein KEM55_007905, partial [Ascosphaera atra]